MLEGAHQYVQISFITAIQGCWTLSRLFHPESKEFER